MLTQEDLKSMHSGEYVLSFEKDQSQFRLKNILKNIKFSHSNKVIDFGCGNGMLVPLIINDIQSYTGIDFSKDFIESAKKKFNSFDKEKVNFIHSDISTFCENRSELYDIAFAMDFSEHVYDQEWVEILKSIRKSLKKNATLYMHTPNKSFFIEIMKEKGFILKQFPEHIAVRDETHNISLIESAGFKATKSLHLPHYNILRFLHPLSYLPFVGKFFQARIFLIATAI